MENLSEATVLDRDALALRLPGHPDWWVSLNNFALYLSAQHNRRVGIEDPSRSVPLGNLTRCLSISGSRNKMS